MIDPVFLLGMPRSGTTWLSQAVEAHPRFVVRLSPMYSYEMKHALDESSDRTAWRDVLERSTHTTDPFMTQEWQRDRGNLPADRSSTDGGRLAVKDTRFHSVYISGMSQLPQARSVVIVRNPLAVLDSWRRSPEFPSSARFCADWRTGGVRKSEGPGEYWGFDDWVRITRKYRSLAEQSPDRYHIVRFEQLVSEPRRELDSIWRFLGEVPDEAPVEFVTASHARHSDDPYSVFKDPTKVLDRWVDGLPREVIDEVRAELTGDDLAEYLT